MADEQNAQQPQISEDAVKGWVSDSVRGALADAAQRAQQQQAQQQQQQQVRQAQHAQGQDPLYNGLRPYLEPGLMAANQTAQIALDRASFYAAHPELAKF